MSEKNHPRIILVTRKTRLQELIERFNTWPQARFYLEHNHVDAQDYLEEHDLYQRRLHEAEQILKGMGRFQSLDRSLLPHYHFSPTDVVVVIGQDGLVANTLKYLEGQPVIAINPDPNRWDGILLPFTIDELKSVLVKALAGKSASKTIRFAEAVTHDGQRMLAVNDLFVGPKSHTSARYTLAWNGQQESQSSSGVIISTGFGSTGWFQSLLAGAQGVSGTSSHPLSSGFAWQEQRLQFTVREPFPSRTTGTRLVFGAITPETPLTLESHMPENGVIFSDGIEADYVAFNSGTRATIRVAETLGQLII
jgi:NAD kinase